MRQIPVGKAIITAQMSEDASIGPDIGCFEGGEQEVAGEDEVRLADACGASRRVGLPSSSAQSRPEQVSSLSLTMDLTTF